MIRICVIYFLNTVTAKLRNTKELEVLTRAGATEKKAKMIWNVVFKVP